MNADRIEQLLKQADQTAGVPRFVDVDSSIIRRRGNRRRLVRTTTPMAVIAILVLAAAIWGLSVRAQTQRQQQIASIQAQIAQLSTRTDATLHLVNEVLEQERRRSELDALEASLAEIPDPQQEIRIQVDKAAFVLVYQADRTYRESNNADSAIESYKRVVQYFPESQWAEVARKRLAEIENRRINKSDSEGDAKWQRQDV
jgi:cell division protein FtsB